MFYVYKEHLFTGYDWNFESKVGNIINIITNNCYIILD